MDYKQQLNELLLTTARQSASDIHIQAQEILKLKKELNQILADHTGQSLETIEKDTDRDFFMSAEEAKKYGLVDEVVASIPDQKKSK